MTKRTRQVFDLDKVTKKFYDKFKKEQEIFQECIQGITELDDQKWYSTILLNRLMFLYFLQRKGFLDGDTDYLSNRYQQYQCPSSSFYRHFLNRLFREGLGNPMRSPELEILLGKIPYLNGGLFEIHPLEIKYPHLEIPDEAFARLFGFFAQYEWHLDDCPLRNDKEINPDVLGYIFEKYINQKQMGAYYTKEDITDYISKNCIIPYLLEAVTKTHHLPIQSLLSHNPNRYLYPAMHKGVDIPLPTEIACGLKDVSQRSKWNQPADTDYALPTETWREHIARRQKCVEIREKLTQGEVTQINQLITYNLNSRQLIRDVIENCEDTQLIKAFYQELTQMSILDPTCGSGAFLLMAVNILEPIYETLLERMQAFVEKGEAQDFTPILVSVATHPNRRYFILKQIILHNLYGVDIMAEATEICKLRLFLKLVAQVEATSGDNYGLEPLPDIDFNIRCGNSLVGFATYEDVRKAVIGESQQKLDLFADMERIAAKAKSVSEAFVAFRKTQSQLGILPREFSQTKKLLMRSLAELNEELNIYLAQEYGVKLTDSEAREKWRLSHQPFHWFVEFYEIVSGGGFDVIIGNPPYVEYRQVKETYTLKGYQTIKCGNLYAFVMEITEKLKSPWGRIGLIVPLSFATTKRMEQLQKKVITDSQVWLSFYDVYPSKVFEGAKQRLTIIIKSQNPNNSEIFATKYHRWLPPERGYLLETLIYEHSWYESELSVIPKIGNNLVKPIIAKLHKGQPLVYLSAHNIKAVSFYVHRIPYNYIKAVDFIPYFYNQCAGEKKSEDYKPYTLENRDFSKVVLAILNSNLFFCWWYLLFEGYHCGRHEICSFPIHVDKLNSKSGKRLAELASQLMADLKKQKSRKECSYKTTGKVVYDEFYPRLSKPIIDEIDRTLAQHYDFTDEELDWIINYDIKYRLGRDHQEES